MRMKKEIQRFEEKFSSGAVVPPERDGAFDTMRSLLAQILQENMGSFEVDSLSYSPYDKNFHVELKGQFVTQGERVLNYKFSESIDPMKPLLPQIEMIIDVKTKVNEESARNEQAKWARQIAKEVKDKEQQNA